MDVAMSSVEGTHYHAGVIGLLPSLGAWGLRYSGLGLHQFFIPCWIMHTFAFYAECVTPVNYHFFSILA